MCVVCVHHEMCYFISMGLSVWYVCTTSGRLVPMDRRLHKILWNWSHRYLRALYRHWELNCGPLQYSSSTHSYPVPWALMDCLSSRTDCCCCPSENLKGLEVHGRKPGQRLMWHCMFIIQAARETGARQSRVQNQAELQSKTLSQETFL